MGTFKQPNLLAWALGIAIVSAAVLFGAKWLHLRDQEQRRAAKERELSTGEHLASAYADLDTHMRLQLRGREVYLVGHIANRGDRDVAGATYEVRCIADGTHRVELGAWEAGASGDFEELLFEDSDGVVDCELGLVALDMGD